MENGRGPRPTTQPRAAAVPCGSSPPSTRGHKHELCGRIGDDARSGSVPDGDAGDLAVQKRGGTSIFGPDRRLSS